MQKKIAQKLRKLNLIPRNELSVDMMKGSLIETDPELESIIRKEEKRQAEGINLIASENFSSRSVREVLGSVLSNKYSEGYPGHRYYGGNEYIDQVEALCQQRALQVYGLDSQQWGVNVQTLSGSPANFAVYTALLQPHDRIMCLDLTHGGHLSHGFQTPSKKISGTSVYFEILPYFLDISTGLIDYDALEAQAKVYRPKMIIAGTSAYSRNIDYERMQSICQQVGCYLLADMAHISGLVAGGVVPGPFHHSDIVTTTTHKSLRGPRGAMVFYRLQPVHLKTRIDSAVFPGMQGGPHNHSIGALATALHQASQPSFALYQQQVVANSHQMATSLLAKDYQLVSGGTDNHLVLVDLKNKGVDGSRLESVLEYCNIYINKNTVPGDSRPLFPTGMRLGSPAMTTRGCDTQAFNHIVHLLDQGVQITRTLIQQHPNAKLHTFKQLLTQQPNTQLQHLKHQVLQFTANLHTYN